MELSGRGAPEASARVHEGASHTRPDQCRRGAFRKRLRSAEVMRALNIRPARWIVSGTSTPASPNAQTRRKKLASVPTARPATASTLSPASTPACLAGPCVAKPMPTTLFSVSLAYSPTPGRRTRIGPPKPRHGVKDRGEQINGNNHVKRQGPTPWGSVLELERADAQQ